jgi:hypothetical protein
LVLAVLVINFKILIAQTADLAGVITMIIALATVAQLAELYLHIPHAVNQRLAVVQVLAL